MRAVVNTEEIKGRMCLVVTELPYQVNPDRLVASIREAVRDGKITGIADMRDETSGRTGQRLVLVLKRDAVPKVVLNNLYKHSQLQQTFGANMLALVDGVPRTLSLDAFIRHWVSHQLDVIARRTAYLKREAEERDHILQGYLKALDMIDEVIHLIRSSQTVEIAAPGSWICWAWTMCRPTQSSPCSCAASPHSNARRSSTSTMSSCAGSLTMPTFSPSPNASARSSATNSTRSWPATATTAARRSCHSPAK